MIKVRYTSLEACRVTNPSLDHGRRVGQQVPPQDISREWHASAVTLAEKYKRAAAMSGGFGETIVGEHPLPSYDGPLWRVRVPVSSNFIAICLLLMALPYS
jgi:hypothetical protein